MKNGTLVAVRLIQARDAGQATVPPHSLKPEASMGCTLSMASWLSTSDLPTIGSTAGSSPAEDRGTLPFLRLVRCHGNGRIELRSDQEKRLSSEEAEELGSAPQQREENHVDRGGRLARRVSRQRGEAETPTSNQPPRVDQGRRLLGPAALRTCPFGFAAKPSLSAPWARGLLSVFWEWGFPDFPACGLLRR